MFFQPDHVAQLWELGIDNPFDCIKFPDDYPIQFTVDFYRVTALKQLAQDLPANSVFHIHPKYALMRNSLYKSCVYYPSVLTDNLLYAAREDAKELYLEPRDEISSKRIALGDTLGFHYTMALPSINPNFNVLDIACGGSFGPLILSQKAAHVVGADLDAEIVALAKTDASGNSRVSFNCEDVTSTSFQGESFDLITSFETIEHVDEKRYLNEMYRILKSRGELLISTPQNSLGHIPMNPQHMVEYSLHEICDKVSLLFDIEQVVGIKQGCIIFDNDPLGTNTFMKLRKKE